MRAPLAAAALLAALCVAARAASLPSSLDEAAAAFRAGEGRKALELLAAAREGLKTPEQRERAALLYADLKDYAPAKALMTGLIRESPEEPRLRLHLAAIVARDGDRAATLAALADARRLRPDATLRQQMAFLHQDFKDYAPARELLDGLIAERPRDLSVRLDRADLAARTGDLSAGLEQLAAAEKLAPDPAERRRMAALRRDLRDLDGAREMMAALVAEFPGDASLRLDLAALRAGGGDRAGAFEALAAARERSEDPDLRRRAAALYQELGADEEARAVLAELVRAAPRGATPLLELAEFEVRRGGRAAALEALAAARGLAPDYQERQRMARLYAEADDGKTARRLIDALIAEQPGDPQLRLSGAEIAAGAGDAASARRFLAEARERLPDPDDLRRMATLHERLGDHGEARALLEEAREKSR